MGFLDGGSPAIRSGSTTLVGGVKTVSLPSVTANTVILLTNTGLGGIAAAVGFEVTRSVGVSFTITSASVLDTSTVGWIALDL